MAKSFQPVTIKYFSLDKAVKLLLENFRLEFTTFPTIKKRGLDEVFSPPTLHCAVTLYLDEIKTVMETLEEQGILEQLWIFWKLGAKKMCCRDFTTPLKMAKLNS